MIEALSVIIGYLIGSISPAYFLAQLLRKTDIRKLGDGNAGATNVYHTLGIIPAVITAVFDLSKGLLAMYVAYLLGASQIIIYSSAFLAVLGHMYPFYLGLRGGQGAATSAGIILYFLYIFLFQRNLPISVLIVLGAAILAAFIITRRKEILTLITMPTLGAFVYKYLGLDTQTIFFGLVVLHIFIINIYNSKRKKIFSLKKHTLEKVLLWRTLLRPLASIFPISYLYLGRAETLWFLGTVAGIFTAFDLVRLISKKINLFSTNRKILKKGEARRFSSMSLFLLSSFATILIFPKSVAIAAIFFLVFGDVFAKFFGLEYGKIKLIGEKTFEGSFGHLIICIILAHILEPYLNLPIETLYAGAAVATVAEALPLGLNDNFTVSLLSSATMYAITLYA